MQQQAIGNRQQAAGGRRQAAGYGRQQLQAESCKLKARIRTCIVLLVVEHFTSHCLMCLLAQRPVLHVVSYF